MLSNLLPSSRVAQHLEEQGTGAHRTKGGSTSGDLLRRGDASKSLSRCCFSAGDLFQLPPVQSALQIEESPAAWPKPPHPGCASRESDSCRCQGCSALNNTILRLPLPPNGAGSRSQHPPPAAAKGAEPLPGGCRAPGAVPGGGQGRFPLPGCPGKAAASRWCCSAGNEGRLPGSPPGTHPPVSAAGRGRAAGLRGSSWSASLRSIPPQNQAWGAVEVQAGRQPWAGGVAGSGGGGGRGYLTVLR